MAEDTNTQAVTPPDAVKDRMSRILKQANSDKPLKPDELADLRRMLQVVKVPAAARLAEDVVRRTIDGMEATTYQKEMLRAEIQQLRQSFGDATAPMLERLIIDQIAMCYLRLWFAEFRQNARERQGALNSQADQDQKALSAAQARYMRAIETLARVRRLKLPAVQLNLAGAGANQLNMAKTNLGLPDDPGAEFSWMFKSGRQAQKT